MSNISFQDSAVHERILPPSVTGAKGTFVYFWQGLKEEDGRRSLDGIPALFQQNGKPQVRYILKATVGNGVFDYPGSFLLDELAKFASAFGIKPSTVSELNVESSPSAALMKLQELLLAQKRQVTFSALDRTGKGAWISRVYEMSTPDGSYLVKFKEFTTRKDGKPVFIMKPDNRADHDGEEVPTAYYNVTVVGGEYEGFDIPGSLIYSVGVDASGKLYLPKTQKGVLSASSRRFVNLCLTLGVAHNGEGGIDFDAKFADPANILPEIEAAAKGKGATCLAEVKKGWIDKEGLTALPEGVLPQVTKQKAEVLEKSSASQLLYSLLEERVAPEKAFNNDGSYTAEALKWLKERVKPICNANRIPANITAMSSAQIAVVLRELGDTVRASQISSEKEENDF